MKKITPEQIIAQTNRKIAADLIEVANIIEVAQEKRGMEGYKQYLEDMQGVMAILEQAPWKDMFIQLLQSAINEKAKREAG